MKKGLIIGGVVSVLTGCAMILAPKPIEEVEPLVFEEVVIEEPIEEPEPIKEPEVITPQYTPREFSYDDAQMLMRIAQAEAGNQGIEGMKLIMAVVLNRVADEDFPDSIEKVIFQEHQFQPVSDGRYYSVELSPEVHLALADIEKGEPIDEEIVAFEVTSSNSLERYFIYSYTVGDHNFYTEKGDAK